MPRSAVLEITGVKLAPQHAPARTLLASVLNVDGRPKEAEGQYRDILAQNPASGQAWSGLAMLKPIVARRGRHRADAQGVATN